MTNEFKEMIEIYACSVTGREYTCKELPDVDKILDLSKEQGVFFSVYSVLKERLNDGKYENLNTIYLTRILLYMEKNRKIAQLVGEIEKKGITVCMLKGVTLAKLYAVPEVRMSGDTDILVSAEDEVKVLRILEKKGFKIKHRSKECHHDECVSDEFGIVEVHIKLSYDIMKDVWFDNMEIIKEPMRREDGLTLLSYTDGYIYVILHAIDHFLSNGMSVRHISDILMYSAAYRDKIDFKRVLVLLDRLKYKSFLDAVEVIGEKYFGLEKSYDAKSSNFELILDDIEKSGIFGKNYSNAKDLFEVYTKLRIEKFKGEDSTKYMTKWRRNNILKSGSFSFKNMSKKYSFLDRRPYLLPIAWFMHLCFMVSFVFKRKRFSASFVKYRMPKMSKEIEEKIELVKKLDMI